MPRAADRRTAATALGVVAVALLVVLAAATGVDWSAGPARVPALEPVAPAPPPVVTQAPAPSAAPGGPVATGVPSDVLRAVLLLVAAGLVVLVVRAVVRRLRRASGDERDAGVPADADLAAADAAEAGDLVPDVPALRRAVDRALVRLGTPDAGDDDVVAAWLAVEEAAADGGVPRAAAWTSTELTTAVLAATDADPDAVRTLLGLYHRARYGVGAAGRLTPADVALARTSLATLAHGFRARA